MERPKVAQQENFGLGYELRPHTKSPGILAYGERGPFFMWEGLTCTGMPILCQLVALTAVALIGAIDVGTFLAAAPSLALIHICGDRVFIIVSPPRLYTGLGWLTSILVWRDFPFEHPLRKVGPGRTLSKGKFSGPRTNQSKAWYCPAGNTQRLELLSHLGTK